MIFIKEVIMKKSLFVLCVLLMLTGCSSKEEHITDVNQQNIHETVETVDRIPVKVIKLLPMDFIEYGNYYGKVSGIKRVILISKTGGTVESISANEGDLIKKGQSLAAIDTAKAENIYNIAVLNEKISRENYNTFKSFLKSGSTSSLKVDESHLNWLESEGKLIDAEKMRDSAFCISPINGTVVSKGIKQFQEIGPGSQTFVIEDLTKMRITVGIPESEITGVKENNTAEVTFGTFPGRIWKGTLVSFSRRSSEQNLNFEAEIEIDNMDGTVLSGSTAKVKLLRNIHKDQLVIPVETLKTLGNKSFAMVLDKDQIVRREVTTGSSNSTDIIALSGLNNGDVIVKEGIHLVNNGSLVKVID